MLKSCVAFRPLSALRILDRCTSVDIQRWIWHILVDSPPLGRAGDQSFDRTRTDAYKREKPVPCSRARTSRTKGSGHLVTFLFCHSLSFGQGNILTLQTWRLNLGASFLLCSPTSDFREALAVLMASCQLSTTAWCRKPYGCTLVIFHEVPCHVPWSHAAALGHSNCLIIVWLRRIPCKGTFPR
jgi:hypothetical protein